MNGTNFVLIVCRNIFRKVISSIAAY